MTENFYSKKNRTLVVKKKWTIKGDIGNGSVRPVRRLEITSDYVNCWL